MEAPANRIKPRLFKNTGYPPGSPYELHRRQENAARLHGPKFVCSGLPTMHSVEGKYLAYVLSYTGWNVAETSRVLGRSLQWVYRHIKIHGLERP